ncbi:hypothetical protein LOTGIDRAFT_164765 [Lottia gigantea]|uniref:G-protein coupled receptors family 1 profile domain-containing protein n=1 Tax=Lottia gigantea TaxID=225164 RepID=V3ZF11_LOTGI|nr:hypothetical protein LOTGIDRAFT_164765 [Lottia gigantea]ESO89743.1 hypothetical protein LOTGIDRAFT_164765 [Lottia gigantea]
MARNVILKAWLKYYRIKRIKMVCVCYFHVNMVCPNLNSTDESSSPYNTTVSPEKEHAEMIRYIFMEIAIPVVCSFGLVGNTLNLLVLTREKQHRTLSKMEFSAHIGLIALAFSDFMFCLLALLFTLLPLEKNYREGNTVLYYHWLGGGFITIFIVTSTWLIVVMAGERYMAVCHPFKARNIISLKRTRISVLGIFLICTICTIPIFLESEIHAIECPSGEMYYTVQTRPSFTKDVIAARRIIWAILFDFIPCVALIYFNTCLIWKIHKAKKLRQDMAPMTGHECTMLNAKAENGNIKWQIKFKKTIGKESSLKPGIPARNPSITHESNNSTPKFHRGSTKRRTADSALNSVTATLVSVVILFLILVSPSELLKFTLYYTSQSISDKYRFDIIKSVTNFMQALNFSTNFVLYCAINKSFRNSLRTLFCWWYKKIQIHRQKPIIIKLRSNS